jgi:prolipoprotein diacylglyceryl transferase
VLLASIPSPAEGVWHLGPVPIRAYALSILAGVAVAIYVGDKRLVARGGRVGLAGDVAVFAVPLGLVGARAYHVMTDPELYFGKGGHPVEALYIWRGGLGIWGAIALGCVGGWLACRIHGVRFPALADALAPGIALAQAIGRWGNWFNQELFGRPTSQWWGLRIDPEHRPPGYEQYSTFQPTFLFESIWDVGTALVVIVVDRRWKLGHGRAFALYVMAYTVGRVWIEYLRIDTVNHVLGLRLNVWTSIVVFVGATAYFVVVGRLRKGREATIYRDDRREGTMDRDDRQEADVDSDDEIEEPLEGAEMPLDEGDDIDSEAGSDPSRDEMTHDKATVRARGKARVYVASSAKLANRTAAKTIKDLRRRGRRRSR